MSSFVDDRLACDIDAAIAASLMVQLTGTDNNHDNSAASIQLAIPPTHSPTVGQVSMGNGTAVGGYGPSGCLSSVPSALSVSAVRSGYGPPGCLASVLLSVLSMVGSGGPPSV